MKNLGFKGFHNYAVTKNGLVWSMYSNKFLSNKKLLGEYKAVTLCNNGIREEHLVHRLIAEAFIPNPENKPCVNHKDGDKMNNAVGNLEWVTHKENTLHAMETGLRRQEVINEYRTIPEKLVHLICKMLDEGARNKDICETTGVNQTSVSSIKSGILYKDISCEYDFTKVPSSNRISEDKVISICEHLSSGDYSINEVARRHGVSHGVVRRIKQRLNYVYISNNYKW